MPYQLNKRIADEIGQYMWRNVPVGNAMASKRWGGTGVMMGSLLAQLNTNNDNNNNDDNIKPSEFSKVAGSSGAEDPKQWEELGNQTYRRIANLPKSQETMGKVSKGKAPPLGFRCNQFAGAMVYMLRLNANVEATIEIVRMGASTSNCHYVVVLNRNKITSSASGRVATDKNAWGDEHILLDPWGAKQRKPAWHEAGTGVSGPTEKFFIYPHDFGNQMYSVCEWTMPADRSF